MKLWAMPCRANQEGRVIVESSDKAWSTGGGNGKPLQYFCHGKPPHEQFKKAKRYDMERWAPRLEVSQYATEEEMKEGNY